MTSVWYSGLDSYKKHTIHNPQAMDRTYSIELLDVPIPANRTIYEIFNDHLARRQTKIVEVLFSGGLDSELVLHSCLVNRIPVRAITMRLHIDNIPLNIHDLYYSEKFCRENNVEQLIIDLDIENFFSNGQHESYLAPYRIIQPHVATHMWLFEQVSGFPVLGGEYPWPWIGPQLLSPIRYEYSQYDRFLSDRNISGVGSMLDYSLESAALIVRTHLSIMKGSGPGLYGGSGLKIARFKAALYKKLGFTNLVPRYRGYGWEEIRKDDFSTRKIVLELAKKYGTVNSSIVWNTSFANILGTQPGSNSKY